MRFADIRLVIGTRPEAIKLKPVARALAAHDLAPMIIFTGQHALDPTEFGFDTLPQVALDCPGEEDPHAHVRSVTAAMLSLLRDAPDLIVVQGDTSSALGAALAALTAGVPIAHVEAGLRTHDPLLPWPEEEYRTAIDADAELLFAPTETAATNLRSEHVRGAIHVTGNTGIDALLAAVAHLPPPSLRDSARANILVTCHRRESWGDGLGSIATAVTVLCADGMIDADVMLHPNPHVAERMRDLLVGMTGVRLIEPCGHDELLRRMRDADIVMSDSGGIQEEAPALGVPLLVLRDITERPEGLAAGTSLLVGTDTKRIVAEARRLLGDPIARAGMSRRVFPFGDGRAAGRIAAIIAQWLKEGSARH